MTKTFLNEGEVTYIQGSGKKPYEVKKVGGIVSCSCPAWRNMGGGIDTRVCKHIKANIDPTCLLPQAINSSSTQLPQTNTASSTSQTKATKKDTAPPVLLAHPWDSTDPTGWWMSEKLDGVRAWWTGEKFLSRLGNEYHAPEWFKKLLPTTPLDGELWTGRGQFQKTVSIVKKFIPNDTEWLDVTYVIFDAPTHGGKFEERIDSVKEKYLPLNFGGCTGQIVWLEQTKCKSMKHLKEFLAQVNAKNGEGVVLRQAGSLYEEGRSNTCLKVKTFKDDEAEVIGYTDGKGKHKGRIGAILVKWKNVEFEIGTGMSDQERENPPKIGAKVTFKYTDLTDGGKPKNASFIGIRDYE